MATLAEECEKSCEALPINFIHPLSVQDYKSDKLWKLALSIIGATGHQKGTHIIVLVCVPVIGMG